MLRDHLLPGPGTTAKMSNSSLSHTSDGISRISFYLIR